MQMLLRIQASLKMVRLRHRFNLRLGCQGLKRCMKHISNVVESTAAECMAAHRGLRQHDL